MEIGELGYGEVVESFREIVYFNAYILDFDLIACYQGTPPHRGKYKNGNDSSATSEPFRTFAPEKPGHA